MADQNNSNSMNNQNRGGNQTSGRRNPADNLSREDRVRGGERSAAMQHRDASGQFSGRKGSDMSRSGAGGSNRSGNSGSSGGAGRNAGGGNNR